MENTASYSVLHDSIDGELFMLVSRAKVVNCFAVAKSVHCQKTLIFIDEQFSFLVHFLFTTLEFSR
jgi:hypothetical protein